MTLHLEKFIRYNRDRLNEKCYYPPAWRARYIVALALYSKAITVSDAVVCLLKGGFAEEAFGLTRTLFDIVFTLRYIASKDTDARAERFYFYFTKDAVNLEEISQAHYPNMEPGEDIQRMIERAKIYTKRYSWSGKTASELAFRTRYV